MIGRNLKNMPQVHIRNDTPERVKGTDFMRVTWRCVDRADSENLRRYNDEMDRRLNEFKAGRLPAEAFHIGPGDVVFNIEMFNPEASALIGGIREVRWAIRAFES